MNTSDIITAEPFKTIFPITNSVMTSVLMETRRNGFDPAQPIIVWKDKHIVIDGHTRLEAARLAGIEDIPIVEREFQDEDAAVQYAIRCQRDRRNLTDADIVRLVEELDKRLERGGDRKSEKSKASLEAIDPGGKSAAVTAEIIGTSRAKVEKVRAIQSKAPPEVKKAVAAGKKSINAAYKETRRTQPNTGKEREANKGKMDKLPPYRPANGMQYARMSIEELKKIDKADEQRAEAFATVIKWATDNEITDENKKVIRRELGVGVKLANDAINILRQIPKKDPLRAQGFQDVSNWIGFNI